MKVREGGKLVVLARVDEAREAGDSDPRKSIISDMEKLMGNSYYGKTATNKEKFTKVKYFSDIT